MLFLEIFDAIYEIFQNFTISLESCNKKKVKVGGHWE